MKLPEFLLRLGYTAKEAQQVGIRQFFGRASSGLQATQEIGVAVPLTIAPGNMLILTHLGASIRHTAAQYPRHVWWALQPPAGWGTQSYYELGGVELTNSINPNRGLGMACEIAVPFARSSGSPVDWQLLTYGLFTAAVASGEVVGSALGWVIPAPIWLAQA